MNFAILAGFPSPSMEYLKLPLFPKRFTPSIGRWHGPGLLNALIGLSLVPKLYAGLRCLAVMVFIFWERFQHVSSGSRTPFPCGNLGQFDNLTISAVGHFRGFCSRCALSTLQSTHARAVFYSDASKRALITIEKPMLCNFQSVPFAFVLFLEQKSLPKEVRLSILYIFFSVWL